MFAAGGVLASYLFRVLLGRASRTFREVVSDTQRRLLKRLDMLDLRSFESLGADLLHRRMAMDSSQVAVVSMPLASSIRYGARATASALYLMMLAPQVAVTVVAFLALGAFVRVAGGATVEAGMVQAIAFRDRLHATIRSLTRGFAQVRLHRARGDALLAQISAQSAALDRQNLATITANMETKAVASVLLHGLIAITGVLIASMDYVLGAHVLIAILFVHRAINQIIQHMMIIQRAGAGPGCIEDGGPCTHIGPGAQVGTELGQPDMPTGDQIPVGGAGHRRCAVDGQCDLRRHWQQLPTQVRSQAPSGPVPKTTLSLPKDIQPAHPVHHQDDGPLGHAVRGRRRDAGE